MTSLEKKLALLKTLRAGDLDATEKLLANLAASAKTNPELYQRFHCFVAQHKNECSLDVIQCRRWTIKRGSPNL